MKKKALALFWLAGMLILPPLGAAAPPPLDLAAMFPELEGWSKDGATQQFQPDNLYEHINGAAENFLAYGFELLAVQNYVNAGKQSLTAEIYFHGTPENAFGIYSSEKPQRGDYLRVGAQGYYEEGVLNFINDAFYVKLNGFDFSPGGRTVLLVLAERISATIGSCHTLPLTLANFPVRGKVAHSERYIAKNFLGHNFLLPAFTTDYDLNGEKFQLFIMKADSEQKAHEMLQQYAALDKGIQDQQIQPGNMTINDPYNGPIQLSWRGVYIWGLNGRTSAAAKFLESIGRNLE